MSGQPRGGRLGEVPDGRAARRHRWLHRLRGHRPADGEALPGLRHAPGTGDPRLLGETGVGRVFKNGEGYAPHGQRGVYSLPTWSLIGGLRIFVFKGPSAEFYVSGWQGGCDHAPQASKDPARGLLSESLRCLPKRAILRRPRTGA